MWKGVKYGPLPLFCEPVAFCRRLPQEGTNMVYNDNDRPDLTKLAKGDELIIVQRCYNRNVRYRFLVVSNGPTQLELRRDGWDRTRRRPHNPWAYFLYKEFAPIPGK